VAESPQARTSRLTAEVTRLTMALADEVASTEPLTPEQQLRIQRLRTQRTNILRGIAQRESQGRK
ncbi:MAG: hypothetical protein WAW17_21995, partial [Rhodococcus sp. (in: high G+C Gram-positive bacteria)]|uniref:hypothetical protein n=1 Tax=Rhodococcus sp. TaxID=1831 RepID=UPI003BAFBE31